MVLPLDKVHDFTHIP